MCTGGITRNKEMLDECIAGLGDVDAGSGVGNTGEGHIACLQLGSKFHGRPSVYSPEGMHPGSVSMEGFAQMYDFGAGTVKNLAHFSDSLISPPSGAATPPAESRPDSASSPTRSRPRT